CAEDRWGSGIDYW
nr:immunoglobulin heavy chain junction region [Macaca mulatta]MOX00154.1 immunoglobulin heavy chain junction region [Macaca mulatta]MOX00695.1 immunoglobulin heavy chain junction region [Macaca mulatta]MOX00733.1 immunoglobulin heavy chain junction region [Macaca mulatta]MOX02404.1 immunoglobulin heavy chain junction region [Macaca mulatta]